MHEIAGFKVSVLKTHQIVDVKTMWRSIETGVEVGTVHMETKSVALRFAC